MFRSKTKLIAYTSSLAVVLFGASLPVYATGNTCEWTGSGPDTNFSTVTNWTNCGGTAPNDGDALVFNSATAATLTAVNDLLGETFGAISLQGTATNSFSISGNEFTLTGGISVSGSDTTPSISNPIIVSGAQTIAVGTDAYLTLTGALSGSGNLTKNGAGELILLGSSPSYSGALVATAGDLVAQSGGVFGNTSGNTTISSNASLILRFNSNITINEPFVFSGNGDGTNKTIALAALSSGGNGAVATLSGAITLSSNILLNGVDRQLKITGALSGPYTINVAAGQQATLLVQSSNNGSQSGNGTYEAGKEIVLINEGDTNAAQNVFINSNTNYVINGVRGNVTVASGGTLKGNGTIGVLQVDAGGFLAPGNSPGCLSTGNFTLAGTFLAEIQGTVVCTNYDQTSVTGTVNLTGGTLNVATSNFVPSAGTQFIIIENDSNDAISGTFNGLAEGATYTANGVSYVVSYVGGDGNDVVLTVAAVDASAIPGVPDTGITTTGRNVILITAGLALMVLGTAVLVLRKRKHI